MTVKLLELWVVCTALGPRVACYTVPILTVWTLTIHFTWLVCGVSLFISNIFFQLKNDCSLKLNTMSSQVNASNFTNHQDIMKVN